ncbi:MAG: Gmad2 immunoglobulin-like domain-containing protein [Candidatus Pacebacteria bacterium]|nr:Gmad2 immunoglobulin-like domain-containing protein [Candidatus Paceibacterota bacterium]
MKKRDIILSIVVIIVISSVFFLLKPADKVIKNNSLQTIPSKDDLIVVESLVSNSEISSPLTIVGKARGTWFFEASFPIVITDWDGLIIAEGYATANGDWMTKDYVPFSATIEFTRPSYETRGFLILKKDNPSGLPENDNALEIPVIFK